MKCNTFKKIPKEPETFDYLYNKTENSTHRSGISFTINSKLLESNSYLNKNKKNENSRNYILFTEVNDYNYIRKNKNSVLKRKPIKMSLFNKSKEQNENFFYCPYKSWCPNNSINNHYSSMSRNRCEIKNSTNKTTSSYFSSIRDGKTKYFPKNVKSRNQTFSKYSNYNISKTERPKKFEIHSLLNLNSNTGINCISNIDKYASYTPNISFGKHDLFINYVTSRERMSYVKKYLTDLKNECIDNDTKKQLIIEKNHIKNTYKLYKLYFEINNKYLTKLKNEIKKQSEINYNLLKEISDLEGELQNLNRVRDGYLKKINRYGEAKKFLIKIKKYILANLKYEEKGTRGYCDVRGLISRENEDFNQDDYLEHLLSKLRVKNIDKYLRIEPPLREFLIFEKMIINNIRYLLKNQAIIIEENEPLKEKYNTEKIGRASCRERV